MSQHLKLRQKNCNSCHKCIRHCPIKAIRFSGNHARIVPEDCIWCGLCYIACPQNNKEIFSERYGVEGMLNNGDKVIASMAPSFAAEYSGASITDVEKALKQLGFAMAEETAVGATMVTDAYNELIQKGQDVIISSACHSVNLLIQKYHPSLIPMLAHALSPMQAHALDLKKRYPGAKVVFIGPCIAKKDEAEMYEGYADAVLTFDQLHGWLEEKGVTVTPTEQDQARGKASSFPMPGGIIRAMGKIDRTYTYIKVDGVKQCELALREIEKGQLHRCFIEMSACEGGCIGGPGRTKTAVLDDAFVERNIGKEHFAVEQPEDMDKEFPVLPRKRPLPNEEELAMIMAQMGKTSKEHELNCGGCGYSTCRDKAIAVFRGKADISMCLPYLKGKAETFSDTIINNTPNGVIVLSQDLEIQQINRSAMNMLGVEHRIDIMGESISLLMEESLFSGARDNNQRVSVHQLFVEKTGCHIELTIMLDAEYHVIISVLRNITEETMERQKKESITAQTVDIADKVVEKQLRIVQEIASLLGETAAETKIALSKLKESIADE